MSTFHDIRSYLKERKKYWIAPVMIATILLALLSVLGGGNIVLPFIYTIF